MYSNSCKTEDISSAENQLTKVCFTCKMKKPLSAFYKNKMKHALKSDLGVTVVCKDCDLLSAIRNLSNVRFNFETNKFEVNHFQNVSEVVVWYEQNNQL